jgi:hypothetical protein
MVEGLLFKKDNIMKEFNISKEYFYRLARRKGSPLKVIEGQWCCVVIDMIDFIRQAPSEKTNDEEV